VGFHYQAGEHFTVNLLSGAFVPAGSELVVIYVTKHKTSVLYGSTRIEILNSEMNSKMDMDGVLTRMFSENPLPAVKFPEDFKRSAEHGQPAVGMTKQQVIYCCGYPPKAYTKKLSDDTWRYWLSPYKSIELFFENDQLIEISEPAIGLNLYQF
jgi:hypothetical protein